MAVIIETPRLQLREMTDDDLDFVAEMLGDPQVMRFYPKQYTRDEAALWLRRQQRRYTEDGHGLWLAEERSSGEPVGQIGLTTQEVDGVREPEVGYLLHHPYWGHGYASEAALATRDHAFDELGRSRIISLIRPVNEPSRRVALRMGMQPERRIEWHGFEHDVFSMRPEDRDDGEDRPTR